MLLLHPRAFGEVLKFAIAAVCKIDVVSKSYVAHGPSTNLLKLKRSNKPFCVFLSSESWQSPLCYGFVFFSFLFVIFINHSLDLQGQPLTSILSGTKYSAASTTAGNGCSKCTTIRQINSGSVGRQSILVGLLYP